MVLRLSVDVALAKGSERTSVFVSWNTMRVSWIERKSNGQSKRKKEGDNGWCNILAHEILRRYPY